MFRKILIIVAVAAISVFCLSGCKKRSSKPGASEEAIKTTAEYEAEARKQINKENMAQELESVEKELELDISQEK